MKINETLMQLKYRTSVSTNTSRTGISGDHSRDSCDATNTNTDSGSSGSISSSSCNSSKFRDKYDNSV